MTNCNTCLSGGLHIFSNMFFCFFYDDFESFLKKCLYSDETYEKDKVVGSAMMVDYYLPRGSRRLNYPEKTVIEVKEKITSGTTRSAQAKAFCLARDYGINRFVLMSHNIPNEAIPLRTSKDKSDVFNLVNFESLQASIEKMESYSLNTISSGKRIGRRGCLERHTSIRMDGIRYF